LDSEKAASKKCSDDLAASEAALASEREARAKEKRAHNFLSALIVTAQNGFGRDVEPFLALCRETWGEEVLWDAVKDLPHGALNLKDEEGEPLHERDDDGDTVRGEDGEPVQAMDPYGMKRTRLMYAAKAGLRAKPSLRGWRRSSHEAAGPETDAGGLAAVPGDHRLLCSRACVSRAG
jgi:hypothetical protein